MVVCPMAKALVQATASQHRGKTAETSNSPGAEEGPAGARESKGIRPNGPTESVWKSNTINVNALLGSRMREIRTSGSARGREEQSSRLPTGFAVVQNPGVTAFSGRMNVHPRSGQVAQGPIGFWGASHEEVAHDHRETPTAVARQPTEPR